MEPQAETIQVGAVLEGKVTSIMKFGAFVELDNRRSGLVHISEIANTFVNDVRDFLQEGQTVKVVVLSTDNGKINLSIKKALPRPAPGGERPRNDRPRPASGGRTYARTQGETLPPSGDQAFEDKLKRFLTSSEGKMADLNRSVDGKRGGRRRR
ncbi:MAG: S1 RNA-binding domain-containing protein [Oscillospiraceae bacterium]|nr:S1 RNA-binding domain-containing protein [Oscillospiraceae bacterium]